MAAHADAVKKADDLITRQQPEAAEALLRRHLTRAPADVHANFLLAVSLWLQRKVAQCEFYIRKVVQLAPDVSKHQNLLGQVCMKLGKGDDAIRHCARACELDPRDATAWNALGAMFMLMDRAPEALEPLRRSFELDRTDMTAVCNYAGCLSDNAQTELGCQILSDAIRAHPTDFAALTTFAGMLNYPDGIPEKAKLDLVSRLGQLLDSRAKGEVFSRVTNFDRSRPLRVGIISADFRTHSCAFFLPALLRGLPAQGFELVCYDATHHPDQTTSPRLHAMCARWKRIVQMPDDVAAREVARDEVDIIIETGGHTSCSRAGVLSFRPAPVTATYLGYPSTTGMRSIDWRLVDTVTDPAGSDAWCTEKLARSAGCFLCFDPGPNPPAPQRAHKDANAPIVFGSFSATKKICNKTLDLWCAVLRAVPGSTLLLKGHADPTGSGGKALRDACAQRSIDPARLTLLPRAKTQEDHLRLYDRLDIALDTYPYHGTTTTCEALLMGVPLVTRAGAVHVSRVSASLLTHAGVPELVANTDEDFVRIAAGLAHDRARLAQHHAALRHKLLASNVCNESAFAQHFGAQLRMMWERACDVRGAAR